MFHKSEHETELDPVTASLSADRRAEPRLTASDEPARIAWQEGCFKMGKAPARLIDITSQGAGLVTPRPGQLCKMLWLGIESLPCEWVKATIRAAVPIGLKWRYHLVFCEPCPVGLLERALLGSPPSRHHRFDLGLEEQEDEDKDEDRDDHWLA
jgi:hypothetical protein